MANKHWWRTKRSTTVKLNPDGESFCKYHYTTVVTWTKKHFVLDTGGHYTMTTRARMNQCSDEYGLGYAVFSERGETYFTQRNTHVCEKGNMWSKANRIPLHKVEGTKIKRRRFGASRKPPHNCYPCTMKLLAEAGGI